MYKVKLNKKELALIKKLLMHQSYIKTEDGILAAELLKQFPNSI